MKDGKNDEKRANRIKTLRQLTHHPVTAGEVTMSPLTSSFDDRTESAFSPACFSVQRALVLSLKHAAPALSRQQHREHRLLRRAAWLPWSQAERW